MPERTSETIGPLCVVIHQEYPYHRIGAIVGPFDTEEEAKRYGDTLGIGLIESEVASWQVMPLHRPGESDV
jgi:hypothetical protein